MNLIKLVKLMSVLLFLSNSFISKLYFEIFYKVFFISNDNY